MTPVSSSSCEKWLGAHVSAAGGVKLAPVRAQELGADAFALFVKNQRRWTEKPLTAADIESFHASMELWGSGLDRVLPHDSYLINLAHPEPEGWQKSLEAFIDEAKRCEQLGLRLLNFHPGAHLNSNIDAAVTRVAEAITRAQDATDKLTFVVETTAGQGSTLGHRFEEVASLLDQVGDGSRVGVCLDTCHVFAAGYDLRDDAAYEATMTAFAETIGFQRLRGVHLNDAKVALGSRVDRHECIGEGKIGARAFQLLMADRRFDRIPMVLETPVPERWAEELQLLRGWCPVAP